MSMIENIVEAHAGWYTSPNQFIMAEMFHGPIVGAYKILFLIVVIWQLYYISKEIFLWKKNKAERYSGRSQRLGA